MTLNSLSFIFIFLPIGLSLYHLSTKRIKDWVLLALSLVFYTLASPSNLLLLISLCILNVILGRSINHIVQKEERDSKKANPYMAKLLLVFGIVINLLSLGFYKYADFFGREESVLWPLGLSFVTFKAVSYLVDIYTKRAELDKSYVHDLVYLSFFAQIISGPLNRYNDMHYPKDGEEKEAGHFDLFSQGVFRYITGFCKKALLSNIFANITGEVFTSNLNEASAPYLWLGALVYSLELYFDFSAYTDMAVGVSNMFGYKAVENFNYPYMTESVSRFWRRWHISLSNWFRDYVYIPLGGSKSNQKGRVYLNLLVVWLLTGIWHGATLNFLIWGLGYFILISFERFCGLPQKLKTKPARGIYRIFSLICICLLWVIFRCKEPAEGLLYIKGMFTNPIVNDSLRRCFFLIMDYKAFLVAGILLCFPIYPYFESRLEEKQEDSKTIKAVKAFFRMLLLMVLIGLFVYALSFIIAGANNPFAYGNF